jgi:site-specific DNA recombinase
MKATIGEAIGLNGGSEEIDLLNRRIDSLNKKMMSMVNEAIQNGVDLESNEDEFKEISEGIEQLKRRITAIQESQNEDSSVADRLAHIQEIIDQREEAKDQYDDSIVRQMIECIKVHKDGKLTIIFGGGYEVEEYIE